jgi:hypothetical protein
MEYKKLKWKKFNNIEYRAEVSVKGLFGIKFICRKKCYANEYDYKYIINGKHFGDYLGYKCNSLEHGIKLCEEKYKEICDNVKNVLFEE